MDSRSLAPDALSDDARELLRHFATLPAEEQKRIVALVRNLGALGMFARGELEMPVPQRPLFA